MAWDESSGARIITKCNLGMRGLVPFWVLRHSFLFINRLPVTIWHPAEDWQGVLFLPPSDAHVRSFLYLLYTLIKLYYQKLWAIQPRLWPRIESDSSRGQESRRFIVQQHLSCSTMISSKEICYKILNCPHHFIGHKSKVKSLRETIKIIFLKILINVLSLIYFPRIKTLLNKVSIIESSYRRMCKHIHTQTWPTKQKYILGYY